MGKKILILGSSGFIGRNIKEFLNDNEEYELLTPSRSELDVLSEESVRNYFKDLYVDVVFHCAIYVPRKESDLPYVVENDLRMYFNMKKMKDYYGKMIYIGSGAEYDKSRNIIKVTEEMVNSVPKSEYGFAKYVIGQDIEKTDNIYNFRIFGLFGKYEDWFSTFISGCCCKAIKNYPLSIRKNVYFDYLWVEDFCRIAQWAIDNELLYHTYNVTSGRKILLSELAEMIIKISEKDLKCYVCESGYANEYTSSNDRLIKEIGYDYVTPIEESVENVYRWYEKNENLIDMKLIIYGE